jgi:hypothetical protein
MSFTIPGTYSYQKTEYPYINTIEQFSSQNVTGTCIATIDGFPYNVTYAQNISNQVVFTFTSNDNYNSMPDASTVSLQNYGNRWQLAQTLTPSYKAISSAISADGSTIISGSDNTNNPACIFRVINGQFEQVTTIQPTTYGNYFGEEVAVDARGQVFGISCTNGNIGTGINGLDSKLVTFDLESLVNIQGNGSVVAPNLNAISNARNYLLQVNDNGQQLVAPHPIDFLELSKPFAMSVLTRNSGEDNPLFHTEFVNNNVATSLLSGVGFGFSDSNTFVISSHAPNFFDTPKALPTISLACNGTNYIGFASGLPLAPLSMPFVNGRGLEWYGVDDSHRFGMAYSISNLLRIFCPNERPAQIRMSGVTGTTTFIDWLTVDSSGNVGIGTVTPGSTLEVRGNVFVSNSVTTTNVFVSNISGSSGGFGTSGQVLTQTGTGVGWTTMSSVPVPVITGRSSSYTLTSSDYYIGVNGTGVTISLPPGVPATGKQYVIKDESGNASINPIILDGNGHTIDGSATLTMATNFMSLQVIWTGFYWFVI